MGSNTITLDKQSAALTGGKENFRLLKYCFGKLVREDGYYFLEDFETSFPLALGCLLLCRFDCGITAQIGRLFRGE